MTFFSSLAWTLISFVLFTALVAIISGWKTRGDDLDSAEGYFLAGRGLPGVVIAGSLLLTNLSAEQLVGLNGQSWKSNMGPIAWEVGSMFTLLALAYYFLPRYLKMGAMTIPSLMEVRYGKGTKTMFSLVIVVMYSILNLPVILYSGAVVFEQIFGISGMLGVSKFQSVAILCLIIGIIGGCYAIFGGLKAVAVSDTINGIGLIVGGLMVPFLGLAALASQTGGSGILDGIQYIVQADPAKMNAVNAWNAAEPEVPWPLIITGMFFNNLYWWCTNQSFVQRALAAKSLKEGQKGAIFCGFLKCLGPLYLVIPGIIAFYLPSIQDAIAAAGEQAIDFAYPALISAIIPKPVMGFFAAVMFGAILSSFNSVLNSASTMFTLDLYRSAFKPGASDAHCVKVGKIYGTIAGCVSIVIAPFVMNAKGHHHLPELHEPVCVPAGAVCRPGSVPVQAPARLYAEGYHHLPCGLLWRVPPRCPQLPRHGQSHSLSLRHGGAVPRGARHHVGPEQVPARPGVCAPGRGRGGPDALEVPACGFHRRPDSGGGHLHPVLPLGHRRLMRSRAVATR